jgi:histidinol-phosphate aminotransferase
MSQSPSSHSGPDYFRATVASMQGYVPGEQPAADARVIKLNTNENPYPPSPRVRAAILEELGDTGERLRLYSDPAALRLRRAAAAHFGFALPQVLHGNGSDEVLALLFRAFVEPGERVMYPFPTYTLYETLAHATGALIDSVDFDASFRLPEALFGSTAKLVLIANPNAPSGNAHPISELARLAKSLRGGILVVDEAYAEFAPDNALELARTLPNVIVTRTFSKSHSLAGMRLGLLFGSEALVAGIQKVKDSYNLDRLAIVAGAVALEDHAWMRRNVEQVRATRIRLAERLTALGLSVLPSETNFLLVRFPGKQEAKGAYEFLKQRGILVRYFATRLLEDAIRISVGTDPEIDALLVELGHYLAA